ncbi:MAG: FkbM family methyltransferase [Candidatus Parvarchaeota archaeon]
MSELLSIGWRIKNIENRFLVLYKDVSIKCRYDVGYDIGHLKEIFLDHVYGLDFKGKVVLDIGMSNGDSAIYFAKRGAKLVIGVEPFTESYELARENIAQNNLDGVVLPVNAALSSTIGEAVLRLATSSPNANSLEPADHIASHIVFDSQSRVQTTTIQGLMNEFNIRQVDFLKMDCEGCEYRVLRSLPPEVLARIGEIRLEFHEGPADIPKLLRQSGFLVECKGMLMGYIRASRSR